MSPITIPGSYRQLYLNRIELALNFIDQNLASELDLSLVAQAANFSPYHFHRIFAALMDETPQDYISRLRVERAANYLSKTRSLSMTEIALACGFTSSSAFSRSFKKYFGVTASEYARLYLKQAAPAEKADVTPRWADQFAIPLPEINIRQSPPIHLAYFASRKGYATASVKAVWTRLFQWGKAHQLLTPETQLVAITFDDPDITPLHKCRYYACITVPESLTTDPAASFFDFPPHLCAVCRMVCEADQIQHAYRALYRHWLPDSGFILADLPPYEVYYDAPDVNPNSSKYVFDLCIPISLL
jgi:AraC family transcriptional regulator